MKRYFFLTYFTLHRIFTTIVFFTMNKLHIMICALASADLEVQLVQLNHCDGVYSNYWNTLLRNLKLSPYINFYV